MNSQPPSEWWPGQSKQVSNSEKFNSNKIIYLHYKEFKESKKEDALTQLSTFKVNSK